MTEAFHAAGDAVKLRAGRNCVAGAKRGNWRGRGLTTAMEAVLLVYLKVVASFMVDDVKH